MLQHPDSLISFCLFLFIVVEFLHVPAHAFVQPRVDLGEVRRGYTVTENGQPQVAELTLADAELRHAGNKNAKDVDVQSERFIATVTVLGLCREDENDGSIKKKNHKMLILNSRFCTQVQRKCEVICRKGKKCDHMRFKIITGLCVTAKQY